MTPPFIEDRKMDAKLSKKLAICLKDELLKKQAISQILSGKAEIKLDKKTKERLDLLLKNAKA